MLREDVQNQARTRQHPRLEMRLEIALLRRRKIMIEDDQARLALRDQRLEFIRLACAHEIARGGLFTARFERADDARTCSAREFRKLVEMIRTRTPLRIHWRGATAQRDVDEDRVVVGLWTIEEH